MAIEIEAPKGTPVNLATADQALVGSYKTQALTGVIVQTTLSAEVELKDGSAGDTLARIPTGSVVGTTFNFLDIKFPNGIYVDAGGGQTGIFTVAHWAYVKGTT